MQAAFYQQLDQTLSQIKADGFWKAERLIGTPQGPAIHLADGREVLNFCANNYLGLANHPRLVEAAIDGLHSHGYGMASVRFICGTQDVHRELEARARRFLGTEDAILYGSLLRRQRRAVRDAARRGGRGHLRRAQPRLDHRRHPPVQGQALPLRATTTWPTWRRS